MRHINILTRYDHRLFDQHIEQAVSTEGTMFHENSSQDIAWDCVVVFDGLSNEVSVRVAQGALLFVAGEPPDAMTYTGQFLAQFDHTFCAHPSVLKRPNNHPEQYFNNWHYGYNRECAQFRYGFEQLRDLAPPVKVKDLSVIMSSLAYMPNHLKRLHFLDLLRQNFGDRIDVYGRGHRFIPFKEDALLLYRFHVCIENCAIPDLWTEKIADAMLAYTVPIYAGCPNIFKYFPALSLVQIDTDDVTGSLETIQNVLNMPATLYERMLPHVRTARELLLGPYNLMHRLSAFLETRPPLQAKSRECTLVPNEQTRAYGLKKTLLRGRRLLYKKYFRLTHLHCQEWRKSSGAVSDQSRS